MLIQATMGKAMCAENPTGRRAFSMYGTCRRSVQKPKLLSLLGFVGLRGRSTQQQKLQAQHLSITDAQILLFDKRNATCTVLCAMCQLMTTNKSINVEVEFCALQGVT
eukprot:711862-Prorocentrum_minimum.AAC.1